MDNSRKQPVGKVNDDIITERYNALIKADLKKSNSGDLMCLCIMLLPGIILLFVFIIIYLILIKDSQVEIQNNEYCNKEEAKSSFIGLSLSFFNFLMPIGKFYAWGIPYNNNSKMYELIFETLTCGFLAIIIHNIFFTAMFLAAMFLRKGNDLGRPFLLFTSFLCSALFTFVMTIIWYSHDIKGFSNNTITDQHNCPLIPIK